MGCASARRRRSRAAWPCWPRPGPGERPAVLEAIFTGLARAATRRARPSWRRCSGPTTPACATGALDALRAMPGRAVRPCCRSAVDPDADVRMLAARWPEVARRVRPTGYSAICSIGRPIRTSAPPPSKCWRRSAGPRPSRPWLAGRAVCRRAPSSPSASGLQSTRIGSSP